MRRLIILAGVVTLAFASGCSATSNSTPTPTPTADRASDELTVYITKRLNPDVDNGLEVKGGVELTKPSDVARLRGAPEDFTAFMRKDLARGIAAVTEALAKENTTWQQEGCKTPSGTTVYGVAPTVATGDVWECGGGGFATIWAKRDGRWRLAAGSQVGWNCGELRKWKVPAEITGATCLTTPGSWHRAPYDGPDK